MRVNLDKSSFEQLLFYYEWILSLTDLRQHILRKNTRNGIRLSYFGGRKLQTGHDCWNVGVNKMWIKLDNASCYEFIIRPTSLHTRIVFGVTKYLLSGTYIKVVNDQWFEALKSMQAFPKTDLRQDILRKKIQCLDAGSERKPRIRWGVVDDKMSETMLIKIIYFVSVI